MAAKTAGLLAAGTAAGAGAGTGYRALTAPPAAAGPQPAFGPIGPPGSELGLSPPLFGMPAPGVVLPAPSPGMPSAVPEPSSAMVLAAGLVLVLVIRRATRRRAQPL